MENGKVFEGSKIGELVENIINKFSEAGISVDEGKIVLKRTKKILGEYSKIEKID